MDEPEPCGPLLATGRAADVFEHDPGTVLRRYRDDQRVEIEATVMRHARAAGYPVPEVHLAVGRTMVMERVDGPSLREELSLRPWRFRGLAKGLAELHDRLGEIPAPAGLPSALIDGDRLVHLDLHPENVVVGPSGLVVIDWSNARRGRPAIDVSTTWVISATSEIDGRFGRLLGAARGEFLKAFVAATASGQEAASLHGMVAAHRLVRDPHLRPAERRALERLASCG
jgi:aminoglycoside phosphotransferase (APT) family kinase protein